MATLEESITALRQVLGTPRQRRGWDWLVRQRMSAVKDALLDETARPSEVWLAARAGAVLRERNLLVGRLAALGPDLAEGADSGAVQQRLQRLLQDLDRHRQRLSDLVYDSVALELGGSE